MHDKRCGLLKRQEIAQLNLITSKIEVDASGTPTGQIRASRSHVVLPQVGWARALILDTSAMQTLYFHRSTLTVTRMVVDHIVSARASSFRMREDLYRIDLCDERSDMFNMQSDMFNMQIANPSEVALEIVTPAISAEAVDMGPLFVSYEYYEMRGMDGNR